MKCKVIPFLLLIACDDMPLQGNIEQLPRDSYVEIRQDCHDLYYMTKAIPDRGWFNQLAIEWYSGAEIVKSEDNTHTLKMLHNKYGLMVLISDPDYVSVETTFYAWEDPQDKIDLLNLFDKCK